LLLLLKEVVNSTALGLKTNIYVIKIQLLTDFLT